MHKHNSAWEEAINVCKIHGNDLELSELARKWAESMGPEKGIQVLLKHNLVDAVIDYLLERKEFTEAFNMANVLAILEKLQAQSAQRSLQVRHQAGGRGQVQGG